SLLLTITLRRPAAPVALTPATSALTTLAICLTALHLLFRYPGAESDRDGAIRLPALPGLRVVLWLFVATAAVALVAGYVVFGAFLAGRPPARLAVPAAPSAGLRFFPALLTARLTRDPALGPRVRKLF